MAKKLGQDYRLWIETAVAGTYAEIKGQQTLKVSRKGSNIDTSDKSDYPYGTAVPGRRALSIDFSLLPNLPDTAWTRLETQFTAGATTKFQIRKGGSTGGTPDVVFDGLMTIGDLDTDYPDSAPVSGSGQLVPASAPTVDALA